MDRLYWNRGFVLEVRELASTPDYLVIGARPREPIWSLLPIGTVSDFAAATCLCEKLEP